MGFTNSEWAADGSLNVTRMNTASQEVGNNAKFSINGTYYTSTSNNITSDVSRIKGLTINLKGLTDGSAITLTVERDKETLKLEKLPKFIVSGTATHITAEQIAKLEQSDDIDNVNFIPLETKDIIAGVSNELVERILTNLKANVTVVVHTFFMVLL